MADRDTLAEALARAGFAFERDVWCASWPADEQEAFALGQTRNALERREAVQDLRRAKIADDLLAAGWRPPARIIETVEDLEALPAGAIVLETGWAGWDSDPVPNAWLRVDIEDVGLQWLDFGDSGEYDHSQIDLPVIVLWQPITPVSESPDGL
ncbi:hypothetical protein ACQP1O_42950 (plasmid) [Nocardia sp. CA-151230]|uniref:hypothetical protein n=1 Tax=Nocardia sp. CA-151230 TaxID=3239982 RepID=UPI003D8A625E